MAVADLPKHVHFYIRVQWPKCTYMSGTLMSIINDKMDMKRSWWREVKYVRHEITDKIYGTLPDPGWFVVLHRRSDLVDEEDEYL